MRTADQDIIGKVGYMPTFKNRILVEMTACEMRYNPCMYPYGEHSSTTCKPRTLSTQDIGNIWDPNGCQFKPKDKFDEVGVVATPGDYYLRA